MTTNYKVTIAYQDDDGCGQKIIYLVKDGSMDLVDHLVSKLEEAGNIYVDIIDQEETTDELPKDRWFEEIDSEPYDKYDDENIGLDDIHWALGK